eukprot:942620-Pelagomonas_calceolata.AAC.4
MTGNDRDANPGLTQAQPLPHPWKLVAATHRIAGWCKHRKEQNRRSLVERRPGHFSILKRLWCQQKRSHDEMKYEI